MAEKSDCYEELANAIIYKATEDYMTFNRGYFKQKKKYENALKNPEVIVRKEGESYNTFKHRRTRYSPKRYKEKMEYCKLMVSAVRGFFLSDWMHTLTDMDGNMILKKLDEQLEKEGHKIWDLDY